MFVFVAVNGLPLRLYSVSVCMAFCMRANAYCLCLHIPCICDCMWAAIFSWRSTERCLAVAEQVSVRGDRISYMPWDKASDEQLQTPASGDVPRNSQRASLQRKGEILIAAFHTRHWWVERLDQAKISNLLKKWAINWSLVFECLEVISKIQITCQECLFQ